MFGIRKTIRSEKVMYREAFNNHIRSEVRRRRRDANCTQARLAAILGISRVELCNKETGRSTFSAYQIWVVEDQLGPLSRFEVASAEMPVPNWPAWMAEMEG